MARRNASANSGGRALRLAVSVLVICGAARELSAGRKGGKISHVAEVYLPKAVFAKLDTFESHSIQKADKAYDKGDWPQATAEYNSFCMEFERSLAVPYALLRKARALHRDDKRVAAVKAYRDVVDYFPNAVEYAGPALFYMGVAHWESGYINQALEVWAEMAKDEDYSKHPLAGSALMRLADKMAEDGKQAQAVVHYWDLAIHFRGLNREAAGYAFGRVVAYYIRTNPSLDRIQEFYKILGGFGDRRDKPPDDLEKDRPFWDTVSKLVDRHGRFDEKEQALHDRYHRYWAAQMAGRFEDSDDYQIHLADVHLKYERDQARWAKRLEDHFARHGKPGDYDRIMRWIVLLAYDRRRVQPYYEKLEFEKMTNAQILKMMWIALSTLKDKNLGETVYAKLRWEKVEPKEIGSIALSLWSAHEQLARHTFGKISLSRIEDKDLVALARGLWEKDFDLAKRCYAVMKDQELAGYEVLCYYDQKKDVKRGIPQALLVKGYPTYAEEAVWIMAGLYKSDGKYAQAIACYQECVKRAPSHAFEIADCYVKMRKLAQAVVTLQEIEAFFPRHAPSVALKIAGLYDRFGKQKEAEVAHRRVLMKYPDTSQSSTAHNWLEKHGYRIGGGIDSPKSIQEKQRVFEDKLKEEAGKKKRKKGKR